LALRGLIVAVCTPMPSAADMLTFVQLRSSSSRREAFKTAQGLRRKLQTNSSGELIGGLQLILDVRTRWSSTYAMVTRALDLRSSLEAVLFVPEHEENLACFRITAAGWKRIQDIANILKCAHKGQQRLSADSHPTLFMAIP
ncbi:hypothetical protein CALCODRAFT_406310, partial [Calocera cornea HHB12733]